MQYHQSDTNTYLLKLEAIRKSLIDARVKVDLRLENGPNSAALYALEADVSQEDRETAWWDGRSKERRKRDKAEAVELFQRKVQEMSNGLEIDDI